MVSKRIAALFLALAALFLVVDPARASAEANPAGAPANAGASAEAVPRTKVLLNGAEVKFEFEPLIEEGTTLVPSRALAEAMGVGVRWDAETRSVYAADDTRKIRLQIGNPVALVNGVPKPLKVPPKLFNGRTIIPLRFFAEAFGAGVRWEDTTQTIQVSSAAPGREVIAFYAISSYAGLQKHSRYLKEISTKWFTLGAGGRVVADYPEGYREALGLAADKGIRRTALIFQDDPKVLHALLNNADARARARADLAALGAAEGYTGINLNLEGVPSEDREAFTALVRELSSGLTMPLAVTVPAKDSDDLPWVKAYDYAALGELADRLVVMAYGEHYPYGDPGPVASLGWFKRVVAYAVSRAPRAKVSIGIGVYGIDWGPAKEKTRTDDLTTLVERGAEFKAPLEWDEASSTPRFAYIDRTGGRHEVWLENQRSVSAKLEVLRELGIRSLAVWRLGIVPEDVWGAVEAGFLR